MLRISKKDYDALPDPQKKLYERESSYSDYYKAKSLMGVNLTELGRQYRKEMEEWEKSPDRIKGLGNPWLKKTFNLTNQGKIMRVDPALAARLQAQAKAVNEAEEQAEHERKQRAREDGMKKSMASLGGWGK